MRTQTLTNVRTSDLRHGDVVLDQGMRLEIDQVIRAGSEPHPETTHSTLARVLNPFSCGFVPPRDDQGEYRWPVQGNDRQRWTVRRTY